MFYVHVFRIYPHSSGLLTSTQHAPQPHSKTIHHQNNNQRLERLSATSSSSQQGKPSRRQEQQLPATPVVDPGKNISSQSICDEEEEYHDAPINQGLLNHQQKSMRDSLHK